MSTLEAHWSVTQNEVPIAIDLGGIIAAAGGSAAWVSHVQLFSIGVQFEVSVIGRAGRNGHPAPPPVDMSGWMEEDPNAKVWATSDGVRLPTVPLERSWPDEAEPALFAVGGSHSARLSNTPWWLPVIPKESLGISFSSALIGLEGSLTIGTAGWPARSREVLSP